MPFYIMRDFACSQSKGCALFFQIGTNALIWNPKWAKHRDTAYIHVEIDTPFERFRAGFNGRYKLKMKSNTELNNCYRNRWIKKLGYDYSK